MKLIYSTLIFCAFTVVVMAQEYSSLAEGNWENQLSWDNAIVPPMNNIASGITVTDYITRHGDLTFSNNGGKNNDKRILVNDYLVVHGNMAFGTEALDLEIGPEGKLVVFGNLSLQNKVTVINSGIVAVTGNIAVTNSVHDDYSNIDDGVTYSGSTSGGDSGSNPLDDMANSPNPVVRELYDFIMNGGEGTLPVDLLFFRASEIQEGVKLEWASEKEWSFSHYSLEHSTDGYLFNEIAVVYGKEESSIGKAYSQIDENPAKGLNYYRLKAVDIDGKFEYKGLEVIDVLADKSSSLVVFPNPSSHGKITVRYPSGDAKEFCLLNSSGIKVHSGILQMGQTEVNVSNLHAGIYFLQLEGEVKTSGLRVIIR